jgi:16S rRNA (cytosine1402-N4)-methyltransferase
MHKHVPVLFNEILEHCAGLPFSAGWFVDGTLGRGGHLAGILEKYPQAKCIGLDQDMDAIEFATEKFAAEIAQGRLELHHLNFLNFEKALAGRPMIGGLLDLGVSSPQLDRAERGFSFYHDGPLDMRMNKSGEVSAADVVNTWSEQDLSEIFRTYGEVRRPERAAKAIAQERSKQPFTTTGQLAKFFERLDGWYRKGHHPATNYFQAIRIAVNDELNILEKCLPKFAQGLAVGGRLFVITFHSLEDRIAKYKFRDLHEAGTIRLVNKKVIQPTRDEEKTNPRSRSAKLRIIEKGSTP